jgi:hypothetical protein
VVGCGIARVIGGVDAKHPLHARLAHHAAIYASCTSPKLHLLKVVHLLCARPFLSASNGAR